MTGNNSLRLMKDFKVKIESNREMSPLICYVLYSLWFWIVKVFPFQFNLQFWIDIILSFFHFFNTISHSFSFHTIYKMNEWMTFTSFASGKRENHLKNEMKILVNNLGWWHVPCWIAESGLCPCSLFKRTLSRWQQAHHYIQCLIVGR